MSSEWTDCVQSCAILHTYCRCPWNPAGMCENTLFKFIARNDWFDLVFLSSMYEAASRFNKIVAMGLDTNTVLQHELLLWVGQSQGIMPRDRCKRGR
jgi:hypothetical protein